MMLSAKRELPSAYGQIRNMRRTRARYVAQILRSQANIVVMEEIDTSEPADWMGSMKDTIEILGDIVSPAADEDDWEVLQD